MNVELKTVELKPKNDDANASVIWLHGLGAEGEDFVAIPDLFGLPHNHQIRFIFPSAPMREITVNGGMLMRGWYDIYNLDILEDEDKNGIISSQILVENLIKKEHDRGVPSEKIILAGFSQGGAIALYTGLRYKQAVGGIIALSTYQPLACSLSEQRCPANSKTPIFMAHGSFDPVVPYSLGNNAYEQLKTFGYDVSWNNYSMSHTVLTEEIVDIGNFIKKILIPDKDKNEDLSY